MHKSPHRKRGKPLSTDEKWMVVQVFYQCDEERSTIPFVDTQDAHSRTATYTGVGRRQVVQIIQHFRETGEIPSPAKAGNRTVHQRQIPVSIETEVREFILDRHVAGEICNARHIQDLLKERLHKELSNKGICKYLQRIGFSYSRTRKKTRSLREQEYVRQQRHSYLHDIKELRKAGYNTVYLDESYLHHYHGHQFSWFNQEIGDYLERPSGKGRRWCFIHAILETGLVTNACHIFEAKKSSGDYHNMFNALHFQEWWQEKLLPNLPEKCVIVIDRATFHLVSEEQITPGVMKKGELQQWLSSKQIHWEEHWLKPRLLQEVDQNIDKTPIVQKIAEGNGHKVLLLPVHHPELNPIELLWGIVKNECARLLREGVTFKQVRVHLENAFDNVHSETFEKLYNKIKRKEDEYWNTDLQIDTLDD